MARQSLELLIKSVSDIYRLKGAFSWIFLFFFVFVFVFTATKSIADGNEDLESIFLIQILQNSLLSSDDDNDGTVNLDDAFPNDPGEQFDSDGDGVGDNADVFPNNASEQIDSDDDGVGDNADDFPSDSSEQFDTDGDGIGNNTDADDDGDGVQDDEDAFPLDPTEAIDFDSDGIGDNLDGDDDNDGIPDLADNITKAGQKSNYSPGELIEVRIRGRDDAGNRLSTEEFWHVQYFTYDLNNNPDRFLSDYTEAGFFNASFDSVTQEWVVSYPAPEYRGNFRTRVSLYCPRSDRDCGGVTFDDWREEYRFDVTCPGEECEFIPDPEPGINITRSNATSEVADAIQRADGTFLTLIQEFGDESTNFTSASTDFGDNWNTASTVNTGDSGAALLEASDGSLAVIQRCSVDYCALRSVDGVTWSSINLLSETNFHGCDVATCSTGSFITGSIIEMLGGGFLVSYSFQADPAVAQTDVYVSQTSDFVHWSAPVQLSFSTNFSFDPAQIQLPTGDYLLAYVSYERDGIIVLTSDDGLLWSEYLRIATPVALNMRLHWILDGDSPNLFFAYGRSLFSAFIDLAASAYSLEEVRSGIPLGAELFKAMDGSVKIIYSLDLNNQRDVFFEPLD
ncbi:MAG: hypothetical protein AAF756_14510 [Pseudomonadota bacterium]